MLAGLPKSDNAKLENIHFVATSNKVSAMGMSYELVKDLMELEKGVVAYDALLNHHVLVVAPVIAVLCDNVRASELVNHMGSTANKFCRICDVS